MQAGTTHGFPQIQTCLETYLPPSRHKKDLASPRIPRVRLGSRDFDTQSTEPPDFDTIPLDQTLTEQPKYAVHDLAGEGRFAVILLSNRTSQIVPCDRCQNNSGFSRRMGFTRKSIHAERSVKLESSPWIRCNLRCRKDVNDAECCTGSERGNHPSGSSRGPSCL